MGLGPLPDVPLGEAREKALACRKLLLAGADPIEQRQSERAEQAAKAGAHTFRQVSDLYLGAHGKAWRNPKHRAQWRSTLETYAFPVLGDRAVATVDMAEVMRVLEPIWHKTPATATRLRGRIEAVLDYATARGWRRGDNPARWRRHLVNLLPARGKIARVEHHAALRWKAIAAFMVKLRAEQGVTARALEFLILTAARANEVSPR